MRTVGAHNHLERWKSSTKKINHLLLPARMKVHIDLVNEEYTRGQSSGLFAQMRVQARTSPCDVSDERNHVTHTVTQRGQRQAALVSVLDHQRSLIRVPVQITPAGWLQHHADGFLYCSD